MEEKNKPGETVPEPGESERISAERKAALQDIDRKREEKEKLRQTQKQEAVKVHGSLSAYMNWPLPSADNDVISYLIAPCCQIPLMSFF